MAQQLSAISYYYSHSGNNNYYYSQIPPSRGNPDPQSEQLYRERERNGQGFLHWYCTLVLRHFVGTLLKPTKAGRSQVKLCENNKLLPSQAFY